MNIGQIIKKLRKENDITQEKLADYLGISYQAVSKWENDTALPDITLVVPIANFFGVSADYLFALNQETNDERVEEYKQKCIKLRNTGDMPSCISLMREALAEYPRNYWFILELARALQWRNYNLGGNIANDLDEIIGLCERILDDCTDSVIRQETLQVLCIAHKDNGQSEKAIKIANETADFTASKDWLLPMVLEGDDLMCHHQHNILMYSGFVAGELMRLGQLMENDTHIKHLEAALSIYDTIYYDGNALYHHFRMFEICLRLARCYAQIDTSKAMEYLLLCEKHAYGADNIPEEKKYYTSMFVNRQFHSTKNTVKSYTETQYERFLEDLDRSEFAPLHENCDFIELKKRLRENM